jgi:hypothetical protein
MLKVVALPLLLLLCVLVYYVIDRRRDASRASRHAKGNLFFAVFFVYPTVGSSTRVSVHTHCNLCKFLFEMTDQCLSVAVAGVQLCFCSVQLQRYRPK